MATSYSDVNLNSINASGNTGDISTYLEPGLIRALVLVPKGTVIPAASMETPAVFATYVNAKFIADNRATRWFMFNNLDAFKDLTKTPSNEDTGVLQTEVYKYNPKYEFRYMTGMGNFIEALSFSNTQNYDYYFIDSQGAWNGCADPSNLGGLASYTRYQLFVYDMGRLTDKTANMYRFTIQVKNRAQYNESFKYYAANTDPDQIAMLQNVWLTDLSSTIGTALTITTTTDIVVGGKIGQFSADFMQLYGPVLTAGCFSAFNLSTSATLTISSATFSNITVGGQVYYYGWFILSAAPTVGNLVQLTLKAPSATNVIIPGLDAVVEIVTRNQDGANAAVHAF